MFTVIIDFVNEVIVRLGDQSIVIDLSESAEIRMQHESPLQVQGKNNRFNRGEIMEYVVGINRSKKLHFEIEGREAHVLTANFEAFVDDVISGKIDRWVLREIPQRLDTVEDWINHEFVEIEETLERNIEGIQDTQTLLHQSQLEFSQNLISHVEMVQKIGEAAMSVKQAADTVKDMTEALYDVMRSVTRPLWDQSTANTRKIEIA
ncbi:MAG: hypothetical protein HXS54_04185 [Theionarchaea archaeon]|nr:hypothetical protein [Theionarchaea archaeon]